MTTNIQQFIAAGFERIYWGVVGNGYVQGTSGALAPAADQSGARLLGAQNFGVAPADAQRVTIAGDDGAMGIFVFPPTELPSGELVVAALDATFISKAQGTKVYTIGDWDIPVLQPDNPTYAQLCLLITQKAQSVASGSVNEEGFYHVILPKCQIVPRGATGVQTGPNAQNFTHLLVANRADKYPWGEQFTTANQGTTAAPFVGPFWTEKRLCFHTHVGNAADTTFTLAETPAAADGDKVPLWKNGTKLIYTTDYSVVPATKVVTFVAAPASNAVSVTFYEFV